MIRIVIAEDQQMLLSALASLIQLEDDIEVAAQVTDGRKALDAIRTLKPDICLLDIEMPGMSGLDVAEAVRRERLDCRIMIVTTFSRSGYLQRAVELKVEGYLLKDEPIEFLVEAIRKVHRGERVISPDLTALLFAKEENPLSDREREVLRLSAEGRTTDEIAGTLYLTKGTVRNYLSSAIQKLEVQTRQQAVKKAMDKGWL
ncbi:MAG: DNA-binding response regulator [Thermobacillus sp. ZCTH02-B1]|uniref:response regulator transcription factor n=1 Tax=Thermobacillus sp. ZCTH02-B1 TaxID=1858795 RepID=UPI000B55299C|nr:response regulator transcription factor [Thermobacillus sp. ZCTH02-B1]OUM95807.1 MAG: DNA-binding response regulator [Thermobacillus sp. ZCTH02-B1]